MKPDNKVVLVIHSVLRILSRIIETDYVIGEVNCGSHEEPNAEQYKRAEDVSVNKPNSKLIDILIDQRDEYYVQQEDERLHQSECH